MLNNQRNINGRIQQLREAGRKRYYSSKNDQIDDNFNNYDDDDEAIKEKPDDFASNIYDVIDDDYDDQPIKNYM